MRGREHLRRLRVFVRHENAVRLLEFLPRRRAVRSERCRSSVEMRSYRHRPRSYFRLDRNHLSEDATRGGYF